MAFDVEGAMKAGYTPDEINQYLQTKSSNPVTGFMQGASNFLRGIGLGIVPDTAAPLYMAGQEIAQGKNPTPYGGNQASSQELQQDAQSNPFGNQQNLQNEGGSPTDIAMQTGKDAVNAGGWALPWGKGGILARLGIGAAGGAMTQAGNSPGDIVKGAVTGAAGNAIVPAVGSKIMELFGGGNALTKAGSKMNAIIAAHDAVPETGSKIMSALQQHFGTADNPNLDLLPNAPAQETGNLKKLLQKEITSAQSGDLDHAPTLRNVQQWKSGAGAQGKFDNNTTSATNKLFQNISRAYGNVMTDVAPEIAKPYAQYSKALNKSSGTPSSFLGKLIRDPWFRTAAVLATNYAGLRGEGKLVEAPIRAVSNFLGGGSGGGSNNPPNTFYYNNGQ